VYRRVRKGAPLLLLGVVAALPPFTGSAYFVPASVCHAGLADHQRGLEHSGGICGTGFVRIRGVLRLGAYTTALLLNSGMNRASCLLLGACVAAIASLLIGCRRSAEGAVLRDCHHRSERSSPRGDDQSSVYRGRQRYRIIEKAHSTSWCIFTLPGAGGSGRGCFLLVQRSKLGLALVAIHEDEEAAADLGVTRFGEAAGHALGPR